LLHTSIAPPMLFGFPLHGILFFSHPFTCSLCVSWKLNRVSHIYSN
jgi:hypothetical protein